MAILSNAPVWVWVILLVLLAVGIRQLKPREIKLFQPLIAPAIFAPLLILALIKSPEPMMGFVALVAGMILGVAFGAAIFRRNPLLSVSDRVNYWHQRGSVIPLFTYLFIFITRFITSALPHVPIPSLPDYAPSIMVGFTGVGMGILLAIIIFRKQ